MKYDSARKQAHARTLNITITAIMDHLKDTGERPTAELREFLYEKIGDLVERRYRKGFNRGHRQSYLTFKEGGKVPKVLTYRCVRTLAPNQERTIELRSKIKKKNMRRKVTA